MLTKYLWLGKQFDLTTEDMSITSNNFSVDKYGNITANSGTIGGFTLGQYQFDSNFNGLYDYSLFDCNTAVAGIMDWIYLTPTLANICDASNNGSVSAEDFLRIVRIVNGQETNSKNVSGTIVLDSRNPKKCISVSHNGKIVTSLGVNGVNAEMVNAENIICGYYNPNSGAGTVTGNFSGIIMNGHTGEMKFTKIGDINYGTRISSDKVESPTITQTSKAEEKKNFEKYENALETLKNIDIYKYNLKNEDDNTKKHIGFVIGDDFNYSEDVTSVNNDGVDVYSFVSMCCKAIQEQQQEIEELKKEIQELKGEK